jgi:uncharacterized cysteine cluster protein YcgN (CxxCxxCC family)
MFRDSKSGDSRLRSPKPRDLAPARPAQAPAAPAAPAEPAAPFWKTKRLSQMTQSEWESLCDGCGRCCLNKLLDEDTGITHFTNVGCRLLDGQSCRCRDYRNRQKLVKDCVKLTPRALPRIDWLPPTCGYVLVAKGADLPWWHPLVSGDPETVHAAGISVRGRVGANETDVPDEELEKHIVEWPGKWPRGAKGSAAPANEKEGARQGAGRVKAK